MAGKPVETSVHSQIGDNNVCAYTRENRVMIENTKAAVLNTEESVSKLVEKVDLAIQTASKRPGWVVCVIITILTSLCVGLSVALVIPRYSMVEHWRNTTAPSTQTKSAP